MNLVSPTRDENFEAFGPVSDRARGGSVGPQNGDKRPATTVGVIFGGVSISRGSQ